MRILIPTLTLAFVLSLGAIFAYADEIDDANVNVSLQNSAEEIENTHENATVGDENEVDEGRNFFALIYDKAMNNLSEIFSILAFIGTLAVAFFYKRGLLPLFTKAVNGIGQGIGEIRKESERAAEESGIKIGAIADKLSAVEESFAAFSSSLTALEEKLESEEAAISERKKMSVIMSSQVDLLYDIFMSSSLPEYKKEAVGAKFLQMREELNSDDSREEN